MATAPAPPSGVPLRAGGLGKASQGLPGYLPTRRGVGLLTGQNLPP